MELFNREELELLLNQRGKEPCISFYMPTQKGREKAKENSIRFKNLVARAEDLLKARGFESSEAVKILESAKKLIDDSYFWANQSEGLAYFITADFSKYYRLPVEFEELAVVRNSFHLKPLFGLLSVDGQFYVLALSQKDARLLRGTRAMVEEVDLSDVIRNFEEEFGGELPEHYLQFHTKAPAANGTRTAIYYGHGGEIDSIQKERMLKYFRFIDRELLDMLDEKNSPLLLACVDFLFPLYKEASKYPLLFDKGIKGNPENISAGELHSEAWDIVKPYFEEKLEGTKARYHELKGTGKTSDNILEIVPSSFHGRINDIFVTVGVQQWGRYDPETEEIEVSDEEDPNLEDLIDLAAAETFLNKGNVYAVGAEQMPDDSPATAIFRW